MLRRLSFLHAPAALAVVCVAGALGWSACRQAPAPAVSAAANAPASAPTAASVQSPAKAEPVATLKRLENGDRACYIVVTTADGEQSLEGDFDLCPGGEHDASRLIGQRVTYTTRRDRVLAASCEGNPDCGKTDEVDLVITVRPASQ